MTFAFFFLSILLFGHALSEWLWVRENRRTNGGIVLGPAERIASSLGSAVLAWVALNWLLSFAGWIDFWPLLLGSAGLLGLAICLLRSLARRKVDLNPLHPISEASRPIHGSYLGIPPAVATAAGMVFLIWIWFVLWRGTLVPVGNHDALSYHFPKSVLISRAHAYTYFATNDPRLSCQPPNYELLISNFLLFFDGDFLTTGLSTFLYICFVALAMACAERWWNGGMASLGVGVLTAGLPVILLHSGGHKNDLMMAVLVLAGILWAARWVAEGGRMSLWLSVLSFMAGCGTKPQGGLFFVAAMPLFIWGLVRRWRSSRRTFWTALGEGSGAVVAGFVLLGGVAYLIHAAHTGTILGYRMKDVLDTVDHSTNYYAPNYGEWKNFFMYPYLLFTVPFSSMPQGVWVPWRHEYWFWPKYEIFMSHYGMLLTFVLPLIPVALVLIRREKLEALKSQERLAGTLAMVTSILLFLPIRYKILGAFDAFPRYLLFTPVLIATWSLAPLLRFLEEGREKSHRRVAAGMVLILTGAFFCQGLDMGYNDRFMPLRYVLGLKDEPKYRHTIFFTQERAASVVDSAAGPYDPVAIDSGIDGWIYPAYGKNLTRPVQILLDSREGARIHPDVKWVAIDRSWNLVWEKKDFTNMGQFWSSVWKGTLTSQDLAVFAEVSKDPTFKMVYSNPQRGQWVFQRIAGSTQP